MAKRMWNIVVFCVGCIGLGGMALGGCGGGESQTATTDEVRASDSTPTFPQCCSSISASTPEAICDSIAYSKDRCNVYNGGGSCAWQCRCCVAKPGSGYTDAYCSQFDALGSDRCNQVWQGTACTWACN